MKRNPLWFAKVLVRLFISLRVRGPFIRHLFRSIWRKVWLDEKYADLNDIGNIIEHYNNYESDSIDIVMTFLFIPVGTLRLIKKRPGLRLPVEKDFDIKKLLREEDNLVEVTLLTVIKPFRKIFSGILVLVMMRYSYRKSCEIGARGLVIAADRRLYALLTRVIKLPFHKIGESRYYEGSITVPAVMFLDEAKSVLPLKNPYAFKLFCEGLWKRNG